MNCESSIRVITIISASRVHHRISANPIHQKITSVFFSPCCVLLVSYYINLFLFSLTTGTRTPTNIAPYSVACNMKNNENASGVFGSTQIVLCGRRSSKMWLAMVVWGQAFSQGIRRLAQTQKCGWCVHAKWLRSWMAYDQTTTGDKLRAVWGAVFVCMNKTSEMNVHALLPRKHRSSHDVNGDDNDDSDEDDDAFWLHTILRAWTMDGFASHCRSCVHQQKPEKHTHTHTHSHARSSADVNDNISDDDKDSNSHRHCAVTHERIRKHWFKRLASRRMSNITRSCSYHNIQPFDDEHTRNIPSDMRVCLSMNSPIECVCIVCVCVGDDE